MEAKIRVTDRRKFAHIDELDTSDLDVEVRAFRGFQAYGSIYIRLNGGEEISHSGQIGQKDYEQQLGFILESYET